MTDAQHLIVAFSGGADSVLAAHFAAATGLPVTLWYLHHYTTPIEPERQNIFIQMQAKNPQINLVTENADVATLSRRLGYSWEHTASLVRRKRLLRLRGQIAHSAVVTGHNYSDYLETLALRRERKIPEEALPSLTHKDPISGFLRPLYHMTRDEVRAAAADSNLTYFDDPSNNDEKFSRNRIRKQPRRHGEHGAADDITAVHSVPAVVLEARELRMPVEHWTNLSEAEKARTTFTAFRRLAVVRKFTRGDFEEAQNLPFKRPPFFAEMETTNGETYVVFRRGLGASVALPQNPRGNFLRGNAIKRKICIAQPYGHKAVTKFFSEKKLSARQKRRTTVYLRNDAPHEAERIVFHDGSEIIRADA